MSGTRIRTCILHVCPKSRIGGALALACDGDLIRLDTQGRSLDLLVEPKELEARRAASRPPEPHVPVATANCSAGTSIQADEGCDFDFLARPGIAADPEVH